jgi:hypothetical protein
MNSELHALIIWEKSRGKTDEILDDLRANFNLLQVYDIKWDSEHFSQNLTRFYGTNLPSGSFKEVHTGTGPFLFIVLKDLEPKYDFRETTKGKKSVNVNIFDAKQKYRSWIPESYPIHASDTQKETEHDLTLLLGKNLEDFEKHSSDNWDEKIISINSNLIGSDGWDDLDQIFYVLNATTNYVVLRNYEELVETKNIPIDDIDLFSESIEDLEFIINPKKIKGKEKFYYHAKVGSDEIIFDFQHVSDNHYDKQWSKDILSRRIFYKNKFYVPNDEDHFYSLLYHALYHKNHISDNYQKKFFELSAKLHISEVTSNFFFDEQNSKNLLFIFMKKMNYSLPHEKFLEKSTNIFDTVKSILENVRKNPNYEDFFKNDELSYLLINSFKNRKNEKQRQTIIFHDKLTPKIAISYHLHNSKIIEDEFELQQSMYEKYGNTMIPEPLEIITIQNKKILIRKAIPGSDCELILSRNPSNHYIENIVKKIINFHNQLNSKLENSTFEKFENEINMLSTNFISTYQPDHDETQIIENCIDFILNNFKNKPIFERFSNGDFILRNLILHDDTIHLIDFEHGEKTHLYFLEWFRFFKFQASIPTNYFYKIIEKISNDNTILMSAKDFSDFYTNDKNDVSFRLLFEIKNYLLQCSVQSQNNKEQLDNEMKNFLYTITNRLNETHQTIDSEIMSLHTLESKFLYRKSDNFSSFEQKQWKNELVNKVTIIAEKDMNIAEKDMTIGEKDMTIAEKDMTIGEKDMTIGEKDNLILSKNKEYEVMQKSIELYQKQIMDIHQSFVFRILRKYDSTIGKLIPFRPKKYLKSTHEPIPLKEQELSTASALSSELIKKDIICLPIIPWDFRYQRPQHLLSKFAENGHRVFYFDVILKPLTTSYEIKEIKKNIFQINISSKNFFDIYKDKFDESTIAILLENFKSLQTNLKLDPIIFIQFPTWSSLAMALKKKYGWKIIFDCLDDFHGFSNIFNKQKEENDLIANSNLVLASADILFKKVSELSENVLLLHNAGEFSHFNQPKTIQVLSDLEKPIVGYFGAIAEWFDVELVEYLAKNRQNLDFVFIGNTYGSDIRKLNTMDNVHFLGEKNYSELPNYLHKFNACLIPFKITDLIKSTHPVKIYEYFSAGKPVISTSIPELTSMKKLCYIGTDQKDFLEKLDLALEENDPRLIQNRIDFASSNDWTYRFNSFYSKLLSMPEFDIEHHTYNKKS